MHVSLVKIINYMYIRTYTIHVHLVYLKVTIFLRVLTFISADLHKSVKFNTCKNSILQQGKKEEGGREGGTEEKR